ncbi:EamA family transporter [Patescibacteria group bacterium]|nr:EamA family transporter [Patescibacteria group bacterium]MBU1885639.1 EamA family transporter [Patescibacteria group bacterium]
MSYQLLALSAAIIFALIILLVKYITKYVVKDFNSFFFWTYVSVIPFVLFIPMRYGLDFSVDMILPIIISSILLTAGQYLFSRGVFLVDASVISPLFQLQSGFILIFATIFLGERYQLLTYSFLLLMMLGTLFVSMTDKTKLKGFMQKGVLFIIGMQVFHAGANVAVGFALRYTSIWQILFYSFIFNSIITSSYILLKKASITWELSKIKWMFLRAILLLSANTLLYKAFETNVSVSAAIGLLSSPLVFVISVTLGLLLPKFLEKQSVKIYAIRTIGMLMILYGAWNIMKLS